MLLDKDSKWMGLAVAADKKTLNKQHTYNTTYEYAGKL